MPSQYTAALAFHGQDFQQFSLSCARKMGLTLKATRKGDVRPVLILPSMDGEQKRVQSAEDEVRKLSTTDKREAAKLGAAIKKHDIFILRNEYRQVAAQNRRLLAMQKEVGAWKPDTESAMKLKGVMLEEIADALGSTAFYKKEMPELQRRSPASFLAQERQRADEKLARVRQEYASAMDDRQTKERLFRELRQSLKAA